MTDPIKKRIQELVPNSEHYCCRYQTTKRDDWCDHCETTLPTLTLAVVLRALHKSVNKRQWDDALGYFFNFGGLYHWNLEHDNYDQQSEKCKQFIGSLILT